MSKHSPTPWVEGERWVGADSITDDEEAAIPVPVVEDADGEVVFESNIWNNPSENVALSLHRVNTYPDVVAERDRLREALEACLEYFDLCDEGPSADGDPQQTSGGHADEGEIEMMELCKAALGGKWWLQRKM